MVGSGLKARGWTDAMIRDYLGEEDVLAPNPHYRSAPPMRLYYQDRCLEAEESAGFSERATKAAERRRSQQGSGRRPGAEALEMGRDGRDHLVRSARRHGLQPSSWE